MRKVKRSIAALMCLTLALTLAPAGQSRAGKVSKPSIKKKVGITVGKKATVKVKKASKNTKVSWKTSNKSVVKILKKKTVNKGKKARAVVKGVSVGKAKITAVYKLGKKKTKLKCTVTVTDDGTPNGTPTSPVVAPTSNPDTTPAATDKAPAVTDAPKTNAPKTDAPPTVKPTDAPERPTVTNDPYASELVVPMTKANQAFAAEEAVYNEDGTVSVALSPADSGHGICFYFNTEKLSVDLTDYEKLVIAYDSTDEYEMAISLKEYIPDTAAESYWDGADGSKCPEVGGEQYTTFSKGAGEYSFDISSIKETAGGVFIKYNTYNAGDASSLPNAEMTIKSIKLIRDPATVSTQPPATEEPGTSEEPGTTDEPQTTDEPGTTTEPEKTAEPDTKPGIDLSNTKAVYGAGTITVNEDGSVTGTKVEGLLIPMGVNVESGRNVKVTVYGEADGTTRLWLSDSAFKRCSEIQNPMAFGKEYILASDMSIESSTEAGAGYLQMKAERSGVTFESITINKIVVEVMEPGETAPPKPTLEPDMVDLTKPVVIGGKGAYDDLDGKFKINDEAGTESQIYFEFPENLGKISSGESVTITIKGNYSGENPFRVWIGEGSKALSEVKVFENMEKGSFTETFDLKATGACTRITFKSVTQPQLKPITGLEIESIKIVKKE